VVITMTWLAELVAERVAKSRGRISAKRSLPMGRVAGYDLLGCRRGQTLRPHVIAVGLAPSNRRSGV
jgi:hypothetical protein